MVGVYLDLDKRRMDYYVNGVKSKLDAFVELPEATYHLYFSGASRDEVEIVREQIYIHDEIDFFSKIKDFCQDSKTVYF